MRERGAQLRTVEHDAVAPARKLQLDDRAQHLLAARLFRPDAAEQRLHRRVWIAALQAVALRREPVGVGGAHAGRTQYAHALMQRTDQLRHCRVRRAQHRDAGRRRELIAENARTVRHGDDRAAGRGQDPGCVAQLLQRRVRARTAQIRLAVGHGSRTQRQEGGSLRIQCLYAAQKLRDGGGVCAEHADAWKIVSLHSGHPLTKKVSAKRV